MTARTITLGVAALAALLLLAFVPQLVNAYYLALAISLLQYTVLATAWGMFSGPTRYVSLATTAFFGVGAYTVAVFGEVLPWPLVLLIAAGLGAVLAAVVGLSTLRLSGVYFVIFTFGLAELVRQLVVWFEVNKSRVLGRYIFVDITQADIYWQLLVLAVVVFALGWLIARSRLGFALRIIGEDETVATHCGINTTIAKVALFAISATVMALTGAIMAPRWTYIEPSIAFNAMISFQVLIMALLGGAHRLWGPVLGAVPLVLLFELLSARFPNTFMIILGCIFLVIVYMLPRGVAGLLEAASTKLGRTWCAKGHRMSPMQPFPALEVEGLTRAFGGLVAVNELGFRIESGEILGLLGPNGSGKTTALNLMSGLLRPDAGAIRLAGRDITGLASYRIARLGLARTFQLVRVLDGMDCRENVLAGMAFHRPHLTSAEAEARGAALLARVGLGGLAQKPAAGLTYIDRKRLELARALAPKPKLLLLDEWLAGLNPSELIIGIDLIRSLKDDGVTVLLVEHVMDAVRALCDRCVVMSSGRKIAEGATEAVLADRNVVEAYLGGALDA